MARKRFINLNTQEQYTGKESITVGGVEYPPQIFDKPDELTALNIAEITSDQLPDSRYYTYTKELVGSHYTVTPVEKDLADIQDRMIKSIESTANSKFNQTVSGYTPAEMASWSIMEQEIANNVTDGIVASEAQIAGITYTDMVAKIQTNATAYRQAKAYIAGTRQSKVLEVNALADLGACKLYERTPYEVPVELEPLEMFNGDKDALEAYGINNFGVDLNKVYTIENMYIQLQEATATMTETKYKNQCTEW